MTSAQFRYLTAAIQIESQAPKSAGVPSIFWSIWVPGNALTGRACRARGWIEPVPGSAGWPYCTTAAGRRAVQKYQENQG